MFGVRQQLIIIFCMIASGCMTTWVSCYIHLTDPFGNRNFTETGMRLRSKTHLDVCTLMPADDKKSSAAANSDTCVGRRQTLIQRMIVENA